MIPDLGKYSDAVLSAYAVSLLLLMLLVIVSWRRAGKVKKDLEEIEGKGQSDG
ncbi:heme exporter protein CcmD [Roseovarius phycicola]|uniref:Heme exporter protein D n=1 Tax=Roseovarius phycicola TaxID=3080976 RepID=A0ABZ2HE79_9RHOB